MVYMIVGGIVIAGIACILYCCCRVSTATDKQFAEYFQRKRGAE